MARCTGRDVVVVALLVLSCSTHHSRLIQRETVVETVAPRHASVERSTFEDKDTPGCGCDAHRGGRNLPTPSCAETRCVPQTRTRYQCKLFVGDAKRSERPETDLVPNAASVGCDGEKPEIAFDPEGDRIGYRASAKAEWQIFVGGRAGYLAPFSHFHGDQPATFATLDWAKAPAAQALLETAYRKYARTPTTPSSVAGRRESFIARGALAELHARDAAGFTALAARLAEYDVSFDTCAPATEWLSFVRGLPSAERARVAEALFEGFGDPSSPAWRRAHAFALATPESLLKKIPGYAKLVAEGTNDRERALLLAAWSFTDAKAAAAAGCTLLQRKRALDNELENAALLAIGRATSKCPAAKDHLDDVTCGEEPIPGEGPWHTGETATRDLAQQEAAPFCVRRHVAVLAAVAQGARGCQFHPVKEKPQPDAAAKADGGP